MILSRDVNLYFGKSQSGKSHLLNDVLYEQGNERSIIYDFKNEIDATLRTNDLNKLYHHCKDGVFFRVVVSDPLLFPALCSMVATMRNVSFGIDEIQTVVMRSKALNEALLNLIFVGTKNRISLHIATQRPGVLHIDLRSQFTKVVTFNQSEEADRKWIATSSGSRALFDDVQQLKPHHFISYTWDGVIQRHAPIEQKQPYRGPRRSARTQIRRS